MMKRFDSFFRIYLIILVVFTWLFIPANTFAAGKNDTLGSLKQSLKELQQKEQDNKNKKQKTQNEITANKKKMQTAESKLVETREEIDNIEKQIEHTNSEIESLKKETEELLTLYQKENTENYYYSYITGASSITDLIMRIDAMKLLTAHNDQKLNKLELLIKSNEKLKKELANYKVKLNKRIVEYEDSIEELGDVLAELEEGAVTIQDEIKNMKALIKRYEDLGCKDDQLLTVCVSVANNNGWLKPVSKGRITSTFGYRKSPTAGASSYHRGVDIGIAEGTKVYPTANGVVGAIVEKSSCGGNMLYIWATVNGKPYTYVFMHLLRIDVKVGDKVRIDTPVAISGGGSTGTKHGGYDRCTTGAHLHYGLADGGFYGSNKSTPLSKFNAHAINPPGYPGLYQWFYSR